MSGSEEQLRALLDSHWAEVCCYLAEEGYPPPPSYRAPLLGSLAQKLISYLTMLDRWTERVDLVAPAPLEALLERHIIDCLAAGAVLGSLGGESRSKPLPEGGILDVGSGAGLPGLIWALVEPQRPIVLCEPREKRVQFLKEAVRRLAPANVRILQRRMEDVPRETISEVGTAVARALGSEGAFLRECSRFLPDGGIVALLAGPGWQLPEETTSGRLRFQAAYPYRLGKDGARRQLAVWQCST